MTSIRLFYRVPQLINVLHICACAKGQFSIKTQFYDLVHFISIDSMFVPNLEPIGSSSQIKFTKYHFFSKWQNTHILTHLKGEYLQIISWKSLYKQTIVISSNDTFPASFPNIFVHYPLGEMRIGGQIGTRHL